MSSTKSGLLSRLLNMRNLALNPKLFFDDVAENGGYLDALYFLLIISSFLSAAQVISDETLTGSLISTTFLKLSMAFLSILILANAACALITGALAKLCNKSVQVPKARLRFQKTFAAGAFSFAPLLTLSFHSITITICALIATAWLESVALTRVHRLSIAKSVGIAFGGLGLVFALMLGPVVVFEKTMRKEHPDRFAGMIGQPAPDLTLKILGGDAITVKQASAQGVVVLDFWATWCSPCRTALPMVSNAVNRFKDKGVKLYAVGAGEDPALEKKYLEDKHIDAIAATCDLKGIEAYKAQSIPVTIVIDKLGVVRSAHAGLSVDEESELSKAIQSAL